MTDKVRTTATEFWAELKRRRVIGTTVAYLIVAWLLIETTATVFPVLLLPDWTVRLVVILSVLGLPIVVVLAWFFDIQRSPLDAHSKTNSESGSAAREDGARAQPALPPEFASVAVMRFENLSTDEKHKYFADGIATELHNSLAQVHRLRVASRTSSFALSGTDVRSVAEKLNVGFIVSGSVRCIDNQMRLIVELDNATEGVQIWSQTYERDTDDVFGVQHEIASSIASAFGGARLREEIAEAARHPTENMDAWSLVQRARSYLIDYSPETLTNARQLLNRAIELDSDYAAAHAALGSVIAEQVLSANCDNLPDDREAALQSAKKAAHLTQSDTFVLKSCGLVWSYFGQHEKSLDSLRRAVRLAPLDLGAWGYHGWPLVETGNPADLQEVESIMQRILSTSPQHPGAPFWLYHRSVAKTCLDDKIAAVDFARAAVEENNSFAWGWMHYANTLGQVGDTEQSLVAINQCLQISPKLTPTYYAQIIRDMSANNKISELRLQGLGHAGT